MLLIIIVIIIFNIIIIIIINLLLLIFNLTHFFIYRKFSKFSTFVDRLLEMKVIKPFYSIKKESCELWKKKLWIFGEISFRWPFVFSYSFHFFFSYPINKSFLPNFVSLKRNSRINSIYHLRKQSKVLIKNAKKAIVQLE